MLILPQARCDAAKIVPASFPRLPENCAPIWPTDSAVSRGGGDQIDRLAPRERAGYPRIRPRLAGPPRSASMTRQGQWVSMARTFSEVSISAAFRIGHERAIARPSLSGEIPRSLLCIIDSYEYASACRASRRAKSFLRLSCDRPRQVRLFHPPSSGSGPLLRSVFWCGARKIEKGLVKVLATARYFDRVSIFRREEPCRGSRFALLA